MPRTSIVIDWRWEEAFEKSGFEEGGGPVNFTQDVEEFLRKKGYSVERDNTYDNFCITGLKEAGTDVDILAEYDPVGYDSGEVREFLPQALVQLLDAAFPPDETPYPNESAT